MSSELLTDEEKLGLTGINPMVVVKTNPDYDPDQTYIPRSARPEWIPVSLLGKVYVRDDGTCQVGGKCSCNADGIATVGTGWRVIQRVSANVIRIMYK